MKFLKRIQDRKSIKPMVDRAEKKRSKDYLRMKLKNIKNFFKKKPL